MTGAVSAIASAVDTDGAARVRALGSSGPAFLGPARGEDPMRFNTVTIAALAAALAAPVAVDRDAGGDRVGRPAPEIVSETWINAGPHALSSLRGRVVLVEFWTFACHNCRNVEPHIKRWHRAYEGGGLTVIGVHTPEFPREADPDRVRRYVLDSGIEHAVALDNDSLNWKAWGNRYWPAVYLIDKKGIVRHIGIGEGGYEQTERKIRALLAEPG